MGCRYPRSIYSNCCAKCLHLCPSGLLFASLVELKHRETEQRQIYKPLLSASPLLKCWQQPELGWAKARKQERSSGFPCDDPGTGAITCCLPGCALVGSWNKSRERLKLGHSDACCRQSKCGKNHHTKHFLLTAAFSSKEPLWQSRLFEALYSGSLYFQAIPGLG